MWTQTNVTENLHTGTNDTVGDTATAVGSVFNTDGADKLILKLNYTKGAEDGVDFYAIWPVTDVGAEAYREGAYTDVGSGVQMYDALSYRFSASVITDIPIDTFGRPWCRIYQVRHGVTGADGTFTLKKQLFKTL